MTLPDFPWPSVNDLAELRPGTVTTVASLPTVGRSTFTLNMALHNALRGVHALYTSSELTNDSLMEKMVSAMYGVDLRNNEIPLGGPDVFKARGIKEMENLPLAFQAISGGAPIEAIRSATVKLQARNLRADIWFVDSIWHFSRIDPLQGADYDEAMRQIKAIAAERQIPVVITSKAVNGSEDEPLTLEHLPKPVADHSDQVLLLHREGVYWNNGPGPDTSTVKRLKPEEGKHATLRFHPSICRFAATAF